MGNNSIKPEDVLGNAQSFAEYNGVSIRKGSIAAFLKNIDLLESNEPQDKQAAKLVLQELAPAMVAVGLHKHVTFKNEIVQGILEEEATKSPREP